MRFLRRLSLAVLAAGLGACAHSNVTSEHESGVRLADFHRIGVLPFRDAKGQGAAIAQGIETGLQKLLFEAPNQKMLESLAVEYKLDPHSGMRLEAVEAIRDRASADAIVMGVMAPDWSAATFVVAEMEMGQPVMRVIVRPADKKQTAFSSVDEIVRESVKALAALR